MKYLLSLPADNKSLQYATGSTTLKDYFDTYFDLRDMILQTNTTSIINGYGIGGGIGLGMASQNLIFTENSFIAQSGSSVGLGIIGPGVLNSFNQEGQQNKVDLNRTKQYLNWMGDMMSGLEISKIYSNSISISHKNIDKVVDKYCELDTEQQLKLYNYQTLEFQNKDLNLKNQESIFEILGRGLFTQQELNNFEDVLMGHTNQLELFSQDLTSIYKEELKVHTIGKRSLMCPLSKIVNSYVAFKLQQDPIKYKNLDREVFMWLIEQEEYRVAMGTKLEVMAQKDTGIEYKLNVVPSVENRRVIEELHSRLVGIYGKDNIEDIEDSFLINNLSFV